LPDFFNNILKWGNIPIGHKLNQHYSKQEPQNLAKLGFLVKKTPSHTSGDISVGSMLPYG
jgi:hypothetical protein